MPGSSFGHLFRITTFGESHGQSDVTSPRKEPDKIHILSGTFGGKTTGTCLFLVLYNRDVRSSDYEAVKDLYRPGHADYTYQKKYGIRDWRGSGRASGRETAARVAAGAVACKLLSERGVSILAYTLVAGGIRCETFNAKEIERNLVRACDPKAAIRMIERIERARDERNSVGGIVECRITGVPPGIGEPVFDKLDADLAKAMLSIGAVKGIEFGAGFRAADMTGKEHNDQMSPDGFATNNAGGVLGGISTGDEREIRTEGRHDPCICPRIVPVVEAMAGLVLEDHFKRQSALHS